MSEGQNGEGVSPTARWVFRGVWKAAFVIVLFLLVGAVVEALVR